jgi:REP element-mobilizing transposase RayT
MSDCSSSNLTVTVTHQRCPTIPIWVPGKRHRTFQDHCLECSPYMRHVHCKTYVPLYHCCCGRQHLHCRIQPPRDPNCSCTRHFHCKKDTLHFHDCGYTLRHHCRIQNVTGIELTSLVTIASTCPNNARVVHAGFISQATELGPRR